MYPFACLASDISTALPRLHAIDQALAKPGKLALLALLRLKARSDGPAVSMLHPGPDNHLLAELRLPQLDTGMHARSQLLEQGARLRQCETVRPPLGGRGRDAGHADGTHRGPRRAHPRRPGRPRRRPLPHRGRPGTAGGRRQRRPTGHGRAGRAPASAAGTWPLLADAEHCASVVAVTDMTLLRLSKQAHDRYLAGLPDIDLRLSRDALRQWAELDRQRRLHHPPATGEVGCGCGETCACLGHNHHDGREDRGADTMNAYADVWRIDERRLPPPGQRRGPAAVRRRLRDPRPVRPQWAAVAVHR